MGRINMSLAGFAKCLTIVSMLGISALSGCGYTLAGSGSVLPPDVKKIYIPLAENDSTESGIANSLTEAFRDQFEQYGVVEVVDDSQDADATLEARIKSVKRTSRAVTSKTDVALQSDVTMAISATLTRRNGAILYQNENISISSAFGAAAAGVVASSASFAQGVISQSALANLDPRQLEQSQEQQALDQITTTAAQRVYQDAIAPDF